MHAALGSEPRARLVPPLNYLEFVALLRDSYLVLTDSGGVQEEAPALGKPVLILRETTERPEGVAAGVARLMVTDTQAIVDAAATLLKDSGEYAAMARAVNPYGDGPASERIVQALRYRFGISFERPEDFSPGAARARAEGV